MTTMHNPPYPGETLREDVLTALNLTVTGAAAQLGVTRAAFSRVLNGRAAISPEMALRIEKWLGVENGVRDYIHVQDLAAGHVAALHTLLGQGESFTVNLGTGRGSSVLEVVQAFEQASGQSIPYQIVPRRLGDVAQCYADPALARTLLGWSAQRTLADMCADAWRWQSGNPKGYE